MQPSDRPHSGEATWIPANRCVCVRTFWRLCVRTFWRFECVRLCIVQLSMFRIPANWCVCVRTFWRLCVRTFWCFECVSLCLVQYSNRQVSIFRMYLDVYTQNTVTDNLKCSTKVLQNCQLNGVWRCSVQRCARCCGP